MTAGSEILFIYFFFFSIFTNTHSTYNTIQYLHYYTTLTKEKVWEWYGKGWAISDPYVEMVWEGWVMIWN